VIDSTGSVMLDLPIALASLAAVLCYRRFLAEARWQSAVQFSACAIFAILTKGNGFALALFAALALALSGQWRLLRFGAFWLPPALVSLVCLPWYWLTYPLLSQGFRYHWGLDYSLVALPANSATLLAALGPIFAPAALGGAALALRRRSDLMGLCLLAHLLAVLLFQCLVPAALDARYMIAALPAAAILAADGVWWGVTTIDRPPIRRLLYGAVAIGLVAPLALHLMAAQPRARFGMVEAAEDVSRRIGLRNPAVVIVSDSHGEVAFAAEMAMADPARPSRFVIRGSRIFGGGGYNKFDYLPKYGSVADLADALERDKIPLIVLDQSAVARQWAHVDLVRQALDQDPGHWRKVWAGGQLQIFLRPDMQDQDAEVARLIALSAPGHGLAP
jgi:hypothetical protein